MIKTKIYGTIGPNSYQIETLIKMIENGLSGIRINLSHGNLPEYKQWVENIRKAELTVNKKISILADIQGPEIRTGLISGKTVTLYNDNHLDLIPGNGYCDQEKIYISWPEFDSIEITEYLKPEQIILLDDGLIKLRVVSIKNKIIKTLIIQGGVLGERKSVNFPGVKLPQSSINDKDKIDIKSVIKLGIDAVMLPFTRNISDVVLLRDCLNSKGGQETEIYAKIENQEGIDNLESFIDIVKGVVIARGDLGVEIGLSRIPVIQKEIIKISNKYKKESIVVTQMLHSMINSPLPTRAEISDIANAVLDRCGGVMLTGETATGKYPVEAVKYMYETVKETEKWKQE